MALRAVTIILLGLTETENFDYYCKQDRFCIQPGNRFVQVHSAISQKAAVMWVRFKASNIICQWTDLFSEREEGDDLRGNVKLKMQHDLKSVCLNISKSKQSKTSTSLKKKYKTETEIKQKVEK